MSGTLSVEKINSKINGTNTRSIIHFTKHTIHHGFDDLDIDIKLKSKTDPQTTIYVVVYGVKGYVNNVSVHLWDRLYYYDNDSVQYEAPINMNGKDITGVNKIVTDDLDLNRQIDMKSNRIIGVGDGTSNNDAINVKQLNESKTIINNNNKNINLIFDILFKNDEILLINELYFSDSIEQYSKTKHVFDTTGNNEGDFTFYYVFQHNTSTNDEMSIQIMYLGGNNPIYINVNKTRVKIEQTSERNVSFNIPNTSFRKQVWFWIWAKDRNVHIIFSGFSAPINFGIILSELYENINAIRADINPFTKKRGLMTKNIYDNNSEAYQKTKVFERSRGTII